MKCVAKNTAINIYYQANNLETGLDVVFNIWNDSGDVLAFQESANSEIDTCGVYYYDFTTPNEDAYLLVKCSISGGGYPQSYVIKVGSPAVEKTFYASNNFETGLSIPYEIFNSDNNVLDSGNLTEALQGFYYADVSAISKPWFFEVHPLILNDRACT